MNAALRRRAILTLLPVIALLAAGCVNLPANSVVSTVSKQANPGSGSDVRIWPHGPQPQEQPEAIVEGFLQTAASDPTNLTIAKSYLTGDALTSWDPGKVIVFGSDESSVSSIPGQTDSLKISGTEVATVSDNGTYQPVQIPSRYDYTFHVVHDAKNGYRIDQLPGGSFGTALPQEAFRADYTTYYLYFLNKDAPGASMVPVPVYLRSLTGDAAAAQSLAKYLLAGPPEWLSTSAGNAVPSVALTNSGDVTIGADDTAFVPIKSPNVCTTQGGTACNRLADQLMATFSSLASISRVIVTDPAGKRLGSSSTVDEVMKQYHVAVTGSRATSGFYYLDSATHHVFFYDGRVGSADQVGPAELKYSQLAITQYTGQSTIAALVDTTGTKLYLGTPGSAAALVPAWTGHGISSLSWDALGDLWFVDRATGTPVVYRLDVTNGRQSAAQRQNVYGMDNSAIQQIAAAPDGRRIAVAYSEPGANGTTVYSLGVGVVDSSSSQPSLNVSYGLNQPAVNQWTNITGIDWHGSQSLAVLGYEFPSSPLAISELNTDGSPVVNSNDLNAVTINPPKGTTGIEWAGSTLIASYSTGTTPTSENIEQYVFATGSWGVPLSINGTMPSYVD